MPSGTSSNEALNAEINSWNQNQPELFITTLTMQLKAAILGKQLAHNKALYSPTLRQMSHDSVLQMALSSSLFPQDKWVAWCAASGVSHGSPRGQALPLASRRKDIQQRIRAFNVRGPMRYKETFSIRKRPSAATARRGFRGGRVLKRPASWDVVVSRTPCESSRGKRRRTPFTLDRQRLP